MKYSSINVLLCVIGLITWRQTECIPPRIESIAQNDAVHHAILCDQPYRLEILLRAHGADPNQKNGGITPLNRAVFWGYTECVRILCRFGAQPDLPNDDGDTPILTAIKENHYDCFEILCAANASCDKPHQVSGITPLMLATQLMVNRNNFIEGIRQHLLLN